MSDDCVQKTVLFSGRVQGVGFRWTTRRIATDFAVTGYVRNLPDGRVELTACGQEATVAQFIAAVQKHFEANIQDMESSDSVTPGEFGGFTIQR